MKWQAGAGDTRVGSRGPRPAVGRLLPVVALLLGLALVVAAVVVASRQPSGGPVPPAGLQVVDGVLEVPPARPFRVDSPLPVGPTALPAVGVEGAPRAAVRVEIPAVGIDAPVGADLRISGGDWLPPDHALGRSGESAALDARQGTTMLAGHVWVGQRPGVLLDLREVEPGNVVVLVDGDRREEFVVTAREEVPFDALPEWAWGTTVGPRGLVLVTCAGQAKDVGTGHRRWSKNLIVEAVPVAGTTNQEEGA